MRKGRRAFFLLKISDESRLGKGNAKHSDATDDQGTIKFKNKVLMVRIFHLFKHTITQSLIQSLEMVSADTEIIWKISPGLLLISAHHPNTHPY